MQSIKICNYLLHWYSCSRRQSPTELRHQTVYVLITNWEQFKTLTVHMIYAFSTFSSQYYNRQILAKYFFQQTIFCLFKICHAGNFSTMTQASAAQQRMEVKRALREADQGAHFRSNFSHFFIISRKLIWCHLLIPSLDKAH